MMEGEHFRSHAEGVAVGRTFAALKDYQVDGNKEMMAIGIMNIIGSCTSCYVTTGAFSRSAVNNNAGCKTAMSNIVMALTVMVTLLLLMPLFAYTPNVVLAAIIITAVVGLIDIRAAHQIWKMDKMDFLVCICALLGVIFISVQEGLAIAVGLSVFRLLLQIIRPKMVILGNLSGTDYYRNLHHYKDAKRVPGFLIVAVEAPINFANTNYLNEREGPNNRRVCQRKTHKVCRRKTHKEDEQSQSHSTQTCNVVPPDQGDLMYVHGAATKKIHYFEKVYNLRIARLIEEEKSLEMEFGLRFLILDLSIVSAVDTSGIAFLMDLKKSLEKRGLEVVFVNPVGEVMEKLERAKDMHRFLNPNSLFLTVSEAIYSLSPVLKGPV